ncbi:MAG TPA: ABC transporter permease, partial [Gemmataceae bacterium]|nr:ABC transporter permease [Gemmataceae bacterium]
RKYFSFVLRSLRRNLLRTLLSSFAIMVLVGVGILIWSVLLFIDIVLSDRANDLKAIATERWQIPSQMPFSYAQTMEDGAARAGDQGAVKPQDSMTWQFYGGTTDPVNKTRESTVFFFAMDPRKLKSMMDDLESLDDHLVQALIEKKNGALLGRDRLEMLHKKVGERFKLSSMNYKDLDLEFEVVGLLPEGRYDQSAVMNRDYLNDALNAWPRQHNGQKHVMADKTLNLFWLKVGDKNSFEKLADQIANSTLMTAPAVKCETASSGIAPFLDAWQDILFAMRWLVIPAILVTMSLVIANAISISVRERRIEMAVLKVLGFGPMRILALILGEAVLVGAVSGFVVAAVLYTLVTYLLGGIKFPIAFFPSFQIFIDALWWGLLFGGLASFAGAILPAWSAQRVKASEVFSKVA